MVKRGMDSQRTCDSGFNVRALYRLNRLQGQSHFFTSRTSNRNAQDIHSNDTEPQTTDKPSSIAETTMRINNTKQLKSGDLLAWNPNKKNDSREILLVLSSEYNGIDFLKVKIISSLNPKRLNLTRALTNRTLSELKINKIG